MCVCVCACVQDKKENNQYLQNKYKTQHIKKKRKKKKEKRKQEENKTVFIIPFSAFPPPSLNSSIECTKEEKRKRSDKIYPVKFL